MREILKLVVILTAICAASAALLALVKNLTQEARDQARREETLRAIRAVLPPGYENEPDRSTVSISVGDDSERLVYLGRKNDGSVVGFAFQSEDPKGYGGEVIVMIGLSPDGVVAGIEILQQKETPGLGTKIQDARFRDEFTGKTLENADWRVQKDGGSFPQFAGATISPRAVVNAVKKGLNFFNAHREEIMNQARLILPATSPADRQEDGEEKSAVPGSSIPDLQ